VKHLNTAVCGRHVVRRLCQRLSDIPSVSGRRIPERTPEALVYEARKAKIAVVHSLLQRMCDSCRQLVRLLRCMSTVGLWSDSHYFMRLYIRLERLFIEATLGQCKDFRSCWRVRTRQATPSSMEHPRRISTPAGTTSTSTETHTLPLLAPAQATKDVMPGSLVFHGFLWLPTTLLAHIANYRSGSTDTHLQLAVSWCNYVPDHPTLLLNAITSCLWPFSP
jgi:hypothetical protein